jgi:2,3-dihydroxyphenylpropionate 1,2-dioxygenase
MIVGAICLSHSPLIDRRRAPAEVEGKFSGALQKANAFVAACKPDLTILFYPDHLNGFFYDIMPCFCVGVQGESIGDFGTVAGQHDIPEAIAMECAERAINAGVDVGISYKMRVDHGATQPIELLSESMLLSKMVPIFINCVAAPRPSFGRARALGRAVGEWAQRRPEQILVIGSGGLSHDPPLPSLATATPDVRARLTNGGMLTHAERVSRQSRTFSLADYSRPDTELRPLNPEWDRKMLDSFSNGGLDVLDHINDNELTGIGGSGAHELRCWVAALSAAKAGGLADSKILFYEPIEEWITGMGIMTVSRKPGDVSLVS